MKSNNHNHLKLVAVVVACVLCPLGARAAENPWTLPAGMRAPVPRVDIPDVAGPILFTEPELPVNTVIDGFMLSTLNGTPIGATTVFGYAASGTPSTDCHVAGGPPPQMFVSPPGIEGGAVGGRLTMDFGQDVTRVAFGFAFSCLPPETASVTVTAFDAGGATVATATVAAVVGNPFIENQVVLTPPTPFRRVRADMTAAGGCTRFFVDNLGYPPLVTPVTLQELTVE